MAHLNSCAHCKTSLPARNLRIRRPCVASHSVTLKQISNPKTATTVQRCRGSQLLCSKAWGISCSCLDRERCAKGPATCCLVASPAISAIRCTDRMAKARPPSAHMHWTSPTLSALHLSCAVISTSVIHWQCSFNPMYCLSKSHTPGSSSRGFLMCSAAASCS